MSTDFGQNRSRYQFNLQQNYIYMYQTDTVLVLPTSPESYQDTLQSNFAEQNAIARTAPIFSYSNSGPRSVSIQLPLHRDVLYDLNRSNAEFLLKTGNQTQQLPRDFQEERDYVDTLINHLQAIALPSYSTASKMVNPPMVAVRFGEQLFIKGVVVGSVSSTFALPILPNGKYANVTIGFSVSEVEPYDAESVIQYGQLRGLSTSLERSPFKKT